jgi:hypothetical protein
MLLPRRMLAGLLLVAPIPATSVFSQSPGLDAIEVRLVANDGSVGAFVLSDGFGRPVQVEAEALLSLHDFAGVSEVAWIEGRPGFEVSLTEAGADRLARLSTQNVGRSLAIIVDGRVIMAPRIRSPIQAPQGLLLTLSSEAEARQLATRIGQALGRPSR